MKQPALNPFLPSYEYIPDGEPRVFGDRLYLFGSHDAFNGGFYCQNDYVCWSAPLSDLSDWAFEGTIFRYTQDPLHLGAKDHLLQAPDVIQGIDGLYYLYYSMASTDSISVAVCSTPAGAYEFYGHVHDQNGALLGKRPGDYLQFDPALYLENGRVFLYSGICPRDTGFWKSMGLEIPTYAGPMVTELCADMVTVKKEPRVIAPCVKNSKGTAAQILTYGGTLNALSVPDRDGRCVDVLLGFDDIEGHETRSAYQGQLVGRYANRLANGAFTVCPSMEKGSGNTMQSARLAASAALLKRRTSGDIPSFRSNPAVRTEKPSAASNPDR